MSLENSLQEIGAALISVRATERRKNAEALKIFLTGNAAPELLSNNLLKKKGYDWNNLFDDINEYVLKELEKYESSKTFDSVTAPLCSSLLHLCVAGSNKGHAFICCEKLMEACLYILKDKRMSSAIGDAYLNLLYKHILPYDQYVNLITPATWEDLLDVCIDTTLTNHTKLDNFTLLRLICLVMKKGKSCCQFVVPLRNALPRLKTCIQRVESDKKIQEIVTEITNVLLEMLSSESRLTMCEFTESILPFLLKCYDQNADQKKKSSVFKLLHVIITLHHPEGKLRGEEGSLANNWTVWNKYLHSIMEITCLEANYLQKLRKQNDALVNHCMDYFHLASSVFFQNFNLAIDTDCEVENLSKRPRVSLNNHKCFSDLIEELRVNNVPWLGIICAYVQNYASCVTTSELLTILSIAETLVSNNNSNVNWDILEQMTCLVLKCTTKRSDCDKELLNNTLIILWNSCVRNSSSETNAHKPIHRVMQCLLELDILHYQTVQPLIKLYFEKGMPVTEPSINTLSCIYHKNYNKCSYPQERKKCFEWLIQGSIGALSVESVKDLFLRLIANNNFTPKVDATKNLRRDILYETLFESTGKSILFSEGVLNITDDHDKQTNVNEALEINIEMADLVQEYLHHKLTGQIEKFNRGEVAVLEFVQFTRVVIAYFDVVLQISFDNRSQIENNELYCSLKTGLVLLCKALANIIKETKDVRDKLQLLQYFQALWLTDYDPILDDLVRCCGVEQDFFSGINEILTAPVSKEDDEAEYEDSDADYNPYATRHNCIWLLAAYCRKNSEYREEILDLILDPVLYDFTSVWDVKCAFQCIRILYDSNVAECPLAPIFVLMRNMCQELFRNSVATETILQMLLNILDRVWAQDDNMKHNCFIMVKSYLQRCEKLYYPPHVAALVYKCVAKIIELNNNDNEMGCLFKDALVNKIRGSTQSLRLYTCYLLNVVTNSMSDFEVEAFLTGLLDIFIVDVSDTSECILKDESANRTLTLLHSYLALSQTKQSSIHKIVTGLLQIQKDKSLDVTVVKKFLDKITKTITLNDIETYLQNNILFVINYWLSKKNKIEALPMSLFGLQNVPSFLEKYMKWMVPAEILWFKGGNVRSSDVLSLMKTKLGKSEESIIEICFSNIVALCLPYVVTEKYGLGFLGAEQYSAFKQSMKNANKMFQMTRQILDNQKWSNLFVENMAEVLLMAAMHVRDWEGAKEMFNVNIPQTPESYVYPRTVFESILKYCGELIDDNIMQYLCTDQAITIFDILYKLWENVLQEKVFEFRIMSLYSFVAFVESIPLGYDSDAYVCSFTCNSLIHAIKASKNKEEVKVLVHALKITLTRFLPEAIVFLRKSMLKARSVLLIKKEEGYEMECQALLNYLSVDMREHLKESQDVVDFSNASPGAVLSCATKSEFSERLKAYNFTLTCPSHESLMHLREFIKLNKHHVNSLNEELNTKRFSEECKTSVIHQVIYALSNVMKSSSDDKIIIEACNCLSEIGTYDLKTIVVVPPPDTKKVVHLLPTKCFTFAVVAVLSELLTDESPSVTNKAVAALSDLFKYRDGKEALELGDVNVPLLKPFLSPICNEYAVFTSTSKKLEECARSDFWIPLAKEDHYRWLTRITTTLLDILASAKNYLTTLREVCDMKPTICQHILPGLCGLLLYCLPEMHIKTISHQINIFFQHVWKMNLDDGLDSSGSPTHCEVNVIDHHQKMIIQYMLDVVNFVRLQRIHYKTRPDRTTLDSLNYLRLEYDKVAWAASVAGQNLVAIFYGELWAVARNEGIPPSSSEATTNLNGGDNVQRIFRKCFVSIGDMDAIEGCGTAHLTSEDEIRKHLINSGQYTDALLSHDIALSRGGSPDADLQVGVVRSLHKAGMHHLALQYIHSLPETDQLNDIKYDCLTCLGDWSKFVDTQDLENKSRNTANSPLSLIKAFRYACLKDCLNMQTRQEFDYKLTVPLNRAKLAVSRWCQNLNMENCQSVYKVVANLHLFSDIEDYFSVRCDKLSITSLLSRWGVEKLPPFHDFKHVESLISQRSIILEHAGRTNKNFLKDIVSLQLQYAELGLMNDRVQMAQRLLSIAKNMQNSDSVSLVEGQVSWAKGHKEIALSLVRNVMGSRSATTELTAASLRQYGMWMAESKCENPRDIINKYLKKSLDVLEKFDNLRTRLKVYHDIAKFADSEYKQVVEYMSSANFENKLKCMESMKGTAAAADSISQQNLTKDDRKVLKTTKELSNLDEADIINTRQEKLRFLQLAMKYYLLSLKHCEENNLSVFRVVSLWLASPALRLEGEGEGGGEGGGGGLARLLLAVPPRKLLAVLPQLAPRLAAHDKPFADILTNLLMRCAEEHPHHTLPILFSLKNADKDRRILNASRGASGARDEGASSPRAAAAAALVAALAARSPVRANIIAQMERLCDATISFANYKTQAKESKQKIPSAELIHRLGPLDAIPVPIDTIPVRNDCNYSYIPTIVSFDNYFELVGGINCPKKINCRSSDGKRRIVLVKGEDDLRQDAVMQQVFNIVNTLLEKNPVTSRNKLLIRTYKVSTWLSASQLRVVDTQHKNIDLNKPYSLARKSLERCRGDRPTILAYIVFAYHELFKQRTRICLSDDCLFADFMKVVENIRKSTHSVVPMSQQSGVLEWCEGTQPLGDYLVALGRNDGAHTRYRPQDISCTAARAKFTSAARRSNDDKLKIFQHILKNFKPVFHHFFTEHYLDPVTWYERRLAYTKSVATSSMLGYILGLGDRHVHNILIDKNTAEVVHIDFGIAFDQGKALPTPETIPFRLTQDMIAGFGSSGVEGIFRKSCEKTMQLLRDNHETLLTILEVLICDPLYSWTTKKIPTTATDVNLNRAGPVGSVADLAARALLAVRSKLSGTEGGAAGGVAVPGQVARLIHTATDPVNLSRLFHGWQPYL